MKKSKKTYTRHEGAALTLSSTLMSHESALLLSRGDFHLMSLDSIHNPLNKRLSQSCVAVIYMPGFSEEALYTRNHIPGVRYIVALANPFSGKWINGKPSLASMRRVLQGTPVRRGSVLRNLWHFSLAVYDLLFTLGEYKYIDR